MTSDYDLTTREGFLHRADEMTRRHIPPRFRDATATEPAVTAWCEPSPALTAKTTPEPSPRC